MLSKRIIGVILLRDGRAVKSKQFRDYRDVGSPVSQARIMYANGIDELCILNTQGEKGISPLLETLSEVSEVCFIPIAAGGGADKVVVRTAVELIPEISVKLGCQSVVQCFDYDVTPKAALVQFETKAGEIIAQDRWADGLMCGYHNAPVESNVPVIRLGGCGTYQHMLDAFNKGADACAAGSLWAFTDSNPMRAKSFLRNHGVNVRK